MSTPFFSIITVVYNAEDVLEGTARSLMEQSTTDYEWIVVDGASKDATLDIARRFAVEGRDTVVSEPDRGVYDAMNKGLRLAQGEVVQFLNAGDRLANAEVLAHVAAAFGEDVDAVYGDTILELADGRVVTRVAFDPHPSLIGHSEALAATLYQVELVEPHPTTVLILGETGTGKELVARALHDLSRRKEGPFTVVDCGAISATGVLGASPRASSR